MYNSLKIHLNNLVEKHDRYWRIFTVQYSANYVQKKRKKKTLEHNSDAAQDNY